VAEKLYRDLRKDFFCDYDDRASIGKRYRRQDEVGTPFCITVDFDTVGEEGREGDGMVTVRFRDTLQQERIPLAQVKQRLRDLLNVCQP
jgi:glycyl-tRNA synthetase